MKVGPFFLIILSVEMDLFYSLTITSVGKIKSDKFFAQANIVKNLAGKHFHWKI